MSWESLYCVEHDVEAVLTDVVGPVGDQIALFKCPKGGEPLSLPEKEARDTSHLPVVEIDKPEGLDSLPD